VSHVNRLTIGAVDRLQALSDLPRRVRKKICLWWTTWQLAQPIGCLLCLESKPRGEPSTNYLFSYFFETCSPKYKKEILQQTPNKIYNNHLSRLSFPLFKIKTKRTLTQNHAKKVIGAVFFEYFFPWGFLSKFFRKSEITLEWPPYRGFLSKIFRKSEITLEWPPYRGFLSKIWRKVGDYPEMTALPRFSLKNLAENRRLPQNDHYTEVFSQKSAKKSDITPKWPTYRGFLSKICRKVGDYPRMTTLPALSLKNLAENRRLP